MFDPKTNKYPYPEDTGSHYFSPKMDRGIVFDENYPYIDYSKEFAFKRFWVHLLLRILVFPFARVKIGLKIKGKYNLKRYKNELKGGAVTIANHVEMWDYISIMKALHNFKWTYLLAWDKNINGDSGPLVRMVGGIPIPEKNNAATVAFVKATNKLLQDGGFLHIYPEGSMWEYYAPIRPFKIGAASIAIKNNKPILPLAFSYRKPSWFRRKVLKLPAAFTLTVGAPLLANPDLQMSEQIKDLTIRAHHAVCELAGFKGNSNIYKPLYDKDSKRIDY